MEGKVCRRSNFTVLAPNLCSAQKWAAACTDFLLMDLAKAIDLQK